MVDGDNGVGGREDDSVHGIVAVVVVVVVIEEGVVVVVVARSRLWRMSVVGVFDGEGKVWS